MGFFDSLIAPPLPEPSQRESGEEMPTGGMAQPSIQHAFGEAAHSATKHKPQEETHVAKDEEERLATRKNTKGTARQYMTARNGSVGRSARYMSPKGKTSTRFASMTARDAEEEVAQRRKEMRHRASARNSARKAIESARQAPIPTTRPAPAQWRKFPSGHSAAKSANGSGQSSSQLDDAWEAAGEELAGHPPRAQEQRIHQPKFGSERPMTAKERAYQLEKQMEIRAKKKLADMREYEKERRAIHKYEMKQKELDYMRKNPHKKVNPHDELVQKQMKAKEIRERLQMVQERERAWRERIMA